MSMLDLEKAFLLIEEFGGDFEGEKDESMIIAAEKALDIYFPPTYKVFLATLGCGDIEGLEFYGLIKNDFQNSGVPDAIWLTLNQRKLGLPNDLLLVYSVGEGTYFALDTSQRDESGECPVISYGIDGSKEKIADDFGAFIFNELKTVLSAKN